MAASSPRTATRFERRSGQGDRNSRFIGPVPLSGPRQAVQPLMPNIDIPVSADLQEMFNLPDCAQISLPQPKKLKVSLPGGGTLKAFSDLSKGIPTDCALTFSLLMQIGPFLASIECL